jgi:hypothetical protein
VLLLNEFLLLLLFISLSTQSGNFWLHPHILYSVLSWKCEGKLQDQCPVAQNRAHLSQAGDRYIIQWPLQPRWITQCYSRSPATVTRLFLKLNNMHKSRSVVLCNTIRKRKIIFIMALGPTQPPIQWVQGALSLGVKRPGREANHSPPSSSAVKEWLELYRHSQYAFMA